MFNTASFNTSPTLINPATPGGPTQQTLLDQQTQQQTPTTPTSGEQNERDNLRILQTLNVQIQSMALKLDQILTHTEENVFKVKSSPNSAYKSTLYTLNNNENISSMSAMINAGNPITPVQTVTASNLTPINGTQTIDLGGGNHQLIKIIDQPMIVTNTKTNNRPQTIASLTKQQQQQQQHAQPTLQTLETSPQFQYTTLTSSMPQVIEILTENFPTINSNLDIGNNYQLVKIIDTPTQTLTPVSTHCHHHQPMTLTASGQMLTTAQPILTHHNNQQHHIPPTPTGTKKANPHKRPKQTIASLTKQENLAHHQQQQQQHQSAVQGITLTSLNHHPVQSNTAIMLNNNQIITTPVSSSIMTTAVGKDLTFSSNNNNNNNTVNGNNSGLISNMPMTTLTLTNTAHHPTSFKKEKVSPNTQLINRRNKQQRLFNTFVRESICQLLGPDYMKSHDVQDIDPQLMEMIRKEAVENYLPENIRPRRAWHLAKASLRTLKRTLNNKKT